MSATHTRKIFVPIFLLLCLGAAQLACGLFTGQGTSPSDSSIPEPGKSGGESEGPGDSPGQGEDGRSMDDQGESPIEPAFGSDTFTLPTPGGHAYSWL